MFSRIEVRFGTGETPSAGLRAFIIAIRYKTRSKLTLAQNCILVSFITMLFKMCSEQLCHNYMVISPHQKI